MDISEFRRNSPFGHWRLCAKGRSARPNLSRSIVEKSSSAQEALAACPFERGNEAQTTPTILEYRNDEGWFLRVISNKFPLLRIEGNSFRFDGALDIQSQGPWQTLQATGAHEVIIESHHHTKQFHESSVREVAEVLWAACERYHELKGDRRMNYFFLFRNTGRSAGASISHPHWQLMTSVIIPEGAAEILNEYRRYHDAMDHTCLYCDHLKKILTKSGEESHPLFVSSNEHVVAFVPYAPEFLYETWIVPRQEFCNCSFAYPLRDDPNFRMNIARMLLDVTRRYTMLFHNASGLMNYNIVFHTAPYFDDRKDGIFHWHIRILPRGFSTDGGVEIATKLRVLTHMPESWAEHMRLLELKHSDIL